MNVLITSVLIFLDVTFLSCHAQEIIVKAITQPVGLGEGPHWDEMDQKLYFVDIYQKKIQSYNSVTKQTNSAFIKNGPVGVAVPVAGSHDKFVACSGRDIVLVTWDGNSNTTNPPIKELAKLDTDRNDTRCNDGKVDSTGRLWIGTMADEIDGNIEPSRGSLYSIDQNLVPKKEVSPVSISNGISWSSKDDKMYYIDSKTRQIVSYDFNAVSGEIKNKEVVFDLASQNITGSPDGMTIDVNDNLWVAIFNGKKVINIDPKEKKLITTIEMPVERVTSAAFGGFGLETLYVTTSSHGLTEPQKEQFPLAGSVFTVSGLKVKGRPANAFVYNEK